MEDINDIIRNLKDIGCNDIKIKEFMAFKDKKDKLKFLTEYRKILIDSYHKEIEKIDRLDYLVVKIQKCE